MDEKNSASDFLGCGWKFPPCVDPVTGRLCVVREEEDIAEAVKIILFTGKGERMMRPEFGCGIRSYAFSSMSAIDLTGMKEEILDALIRFEPRIIHPEVEIGKARIQDGILDISVTYTVRSTNNPYNLVFPYYLNEG